MTVNELLRKINIVAASFTTWDVPLLVNGKEVDIDIQIMPVKYDTEYGVTNYNIGLEIKDKNGNHYILMSEDEFDK